MENTKVVAPMDGIIKTINENNSTSSSDDDSSNSNSDNGSDSTSNAYITIMAKGDYRIKATASELTVRSMSDGQSMIVRSRVDDSTWTGTVTKIDLEHPDNGIIRVNGETLFDASVPATTQESVIRKKRLHFGLVFQNFNLFPQYTALENVMLAKKLLAAEQPDFKERKREILTAIEVQAKVLLTQMGLDNRMDNYPHQLSGGQCQRVAIARALALQPDILCFDEPTSALDPELTGEVLKVIRELADQNTTMIIVTHEMAFARDVADHVIFMDDGRIVEQGDPRQVFENPSEERTKQFLSRFHEG